MRIMGVKGIMNNGSIFPRPQSPFTKYMPATQHLAKILLLTAGLAIPSGESEAYPAWIPVAPIPARYCDNAFAEVAGKVYLFSGGTMQIYDTATDTWTTKPGMPSGRGAASAVAVNGLIYVMGGEVGAGCPSLIVEVYNPVTDTWNTKTPMPTPRFCFGLAEVNGVIYAVGSATSANQNTVDAYNIASDTWAPRANLHERRGWHAVTALGGKVYAIGGHGLDGLTSSVEEYDPGANTWTVKASMPMAVSGLSVAVAFGRIYALGGINIFTEGWLPYVNEYSPATDTWIACESMPEVRAYFAAAAVNGILYVLGGTRNAGDVFSSYAGLMKARLSASLSVTKSPVQVDQTSEVVLTVGNPGACTAYSVGCVMGLVPGSSPGTRISGPVPSGPVTLAQGASQAFTWTWLMTGVGTAKFTVTVTGTDGLSGEQVVATAGTDLGVVPKAIFAASLAIIPSLRGIEQWVEARLTVTNVGGEYANTVTGTMGASSGATLVSFISGPSPSAPVILAPGAHQTFAWTWSVSGLGTVDFDASAMGTDAFSGIPVSATGSASLLITKATLAAALSVFPSPIGDGQWMEVRLTVTNVGGGVADGVIGILGISGGAALVSPPDGPNPPGPVSLRTGESRTFAWLCQALGTGLVTFAGTARGTDHHSGDTIEAHATGANTIVSNDPTQVSLSASKNRACVGENIQLTARLADALGNAVAGRTLNLSVVTGGGTLENGARVTGANGQVKAGFTLGLQAGPNVLMASYTEGFSTMSGTVLIEGTDASGLTYAGAALDRNAFTPWKGESVTIRVFTRLAGRATIHVYTASGKLIRSLETVELAAGGRTTVNWDGKTNNGQVITRGVFLVRVSGAGINDLLKIVAK